MSRLGRDYLKVGQVMEVLRQRGVRLIAINDGVDSLKGDDDFTPFRNIMNEFYARDTSRKIRSVFKSKGMSGKHLTGTVIYGYLWDEKREHWLVDEEAAEVVHRIFYLTLEGYGPYQIACKLSADRIEIPVVHLARFNEGVNRSKPVKDPYVWLTIGVNPLYVDTGIRIESAADLCGRCLDDVATDVLYMTGNDHALEAADPLELAEIKRRWELYINQLPDYAYLCKDLLDGKM